MAQIKQLKDAAGNFYPVTHKDAIVGIEDLEVDMTGYATEQWVEEQNYLKEHQDISNKVNVADFEEATHVTSAALNFFHSNTLWQTEDTYVKCDKSKTLEEAVSGESDIVYFTTDSHQIVLNGVVYNLQDLEDYATKQWVEEADNLILEALNNKQDKSDSLLETDDKTVIGAINELNAKIDECMDLHYTTVVVEINVEGNENPYDGSEVTLTDLSSGVEERQILNDTSCSFLVLKGHEYKVELQKIPDYYRVIGNKIKVANGDYQQYSIEVEYCADDRFVVLSNGHIYTWEQHQTLGSIPNNLTPELIYMTNSKLDEQNAAVYLPVQQMKGILSVTANWGGVNDEDIPELVNATSYSADTGEYDMERNSNIIIAKYGSSCAAYIATQKTVTVNGQTYSGWLGTAEQYQQLVANNTELQGWFNICEINQDFLSTGLAGWTSSEYQNTSGNVRARIIVNGSVQASPKVRTSGGISVLPFYKDIH